MNIKQMIANYSLNHYKTVTIVMVIITLGLAAFIPLIKVDTDPENMLSPEEPVKLFHHHTKKQFNLSDIVVLGIVNNKHPDGVFNVDSLAKIYNLTEFSRTLQWPDKNHPDKLSGVVEVDILAPSTVDNIEQGAPGEIRFEWLMSRPPATPEEALSIRDKALSNPLLKGTLISEDGKALCLYLPLTSKDMSYKVYTELKKEIATMPGDEEFYITGLPVAEDTFGVEMFIQMAVSAPLAMLVIFLLMLFFFRKLVLIISPLIVAMVSVISTMGLLIGLGYPVHIMSSMIPIFLMPIAVVDSVHILSEFFGLYTPQKGRRETIREVMDNLFTPMLYTSLTSAAGFISLALTPIPPVQVFGIFVAIGILMAWVWTVLFVPAYVMFISEKNLANFGTAASAEHKQTLLTRLLHSSGRFTYSSAKLIITIMVILTAVAGYGISRIRINDNPVKWFSKSHPIRMADTELNRHFGGTYMAYLVLDTVKEKGVSSEYLQALTQRLKKKSDELKNEFPQVDSAFNEAKTILTQNAPTTNDKDTLLDDMSRFANDKMESLPDHDTMYDIWYELADFFDLEKENLKLFKQPEVLRYLERLQDYLAGIKVNGRTLVGKTNSVSDVVKKVYQELIDGRPENYRIPDTSAAVAQSLLQFQSSHNPDDLWHLVSSDYMHANIWCQLTSGDNMDMNKVIAAVEQFFRDNPPPAPLAHNWAGLTYINTVWQDKMVSGMLQSFMGSFLVVFIMMSILFRSPLWGIICMIPLTITIVLIYGMIGLVGKDYDMPVAVLSSLTLGLAVDFAIHFLERARDTYRQKGSWQASVPEMFGEPAHAISRNVLVIAIGFLPLLAAPLVPYKTVGILLCAIMTVSGTITLLVLPAILRLAEKVLFKPAKQLHGVSCNCAFCLVISISSVLLIAINAHQYFKIGWSKLTWISIVIIPLSALICGIMSRRKACKNL
ncbi:MAG: MMPL family transporter [Sedimentisphaerales bacterium]|nr:MMPL family transporter [Sedimentisphaerales bacterium]